VPRNLGRSLRQSRWRFSVGSLRTARAEASAAARGVPMVTASSWAQGITTMGTGFAPADPPPTAKA